MVDISVLANVFQLVFWGEKLFVYIIDKCSHNQCGAVGWASYSKAKGHQVTSQSGQMLGLLALSLVGVWGV